MRSVQSQAKNLGFPLDELLSPSVVNLTFLYLPISQALDRTRPLRSHLPWTKLARRITSTVHPENAGICQIDDILGRRNVIRDSYVDLKSNLLSPPAADKLN